MSIEQKNRTKKREFDFMENSEFEKYFTPDRDPDLHIPFDKIQLLEHQNSKKVTKDKPFILEYDASVIPGESLIDKLQINFKKHGFDPNQISESDVIYNVKNPPSTGEEGNSPNIENYEGTGGPPPINLD